MLSASQTQLLANEIQPPIHNLLNGTYRIAEAQKACNENLQITRSEYPYEIKATVFDRMPTVLKGVKKLPKFGCYIEGGFLNLCVYLPTLESIFAEAQKARPLTFKVIFETMVVIDFIHELDHAALGKISRVGDPVPSPKTKIEYEQMVWPRTCENVIRPLEEVHGLELYPTHKEMYFAWVGAGRNQESKPWKEYISNLCGDALSAQ